MTADIPACGECEYKDMRKIGRTDTPGWCAVCVAQSSRGRVIEYQYARDTKWARREVVDKVEARIAPRWCPKRRKNNGEMG